MTQEQIFNEWETACIKLKSLNSFVQNDFNLMLKDGYVTREEIKKSIPDFNSLYLDATTKISELKTEIEKLLNKYAE